jgi:hypothetical protein
VNRRATPSTARRMAAAAMPVMVDLKFNFQISTFKEEGRIRADRVWGCGGGEMGGGGDCLPGIVVDWNLGRCPISANLGR